MDTCKTLGSYVNRWFLPQELRDLALTLAVLERKIYVYVENELLFDARNRNTNSSNSLRSGLPAPASQITLQHALDRADDASNDGRVLKSLMLGGVSSLMYNLQLVLRDTNDCLEKVGNRVSKADTAIALASVFATMSALVLSYRYAPIGFTPPFTKWLKSSFSWGQVQVLTAASIAGTTADQWLGPRATVLAKQLLGRGQGLALTVLRVVYSYSGIGAPVLMLVATYALVRHIMHRIRMRKIRVCHHQLQMLLRLYDVVIETVSHVCRKSYERI